MGPCCEAVLLPRHSKTFSAPVIVPKSYSRLIPEAWGDPYGVSQVRGLLAKLLDIAS